MIRGRISKERNGKISMAGPAVNIILAIIFLILAFIFTQGFAAIVVGTGIFINILIGGFNLLPVWLFDGKKILAWNKIVYFTMVIVTIGLFVLSYYLDLLPFI